ncbi:MAG: hypothetical protein ACE5I9_13260, partial [Candidatus Methylomirabilales bacterium]
RQPGDQVDACHGAPLPDAVALGSGGSAATSFLGLPVILLQSLLALLPFPADHHPLGRLRTGKGHVRARELGCIHGRSLSKQPGLVSGMG